MENNTVRRIVWIGAYMSRAEFEDNAKKKYYDQVAANNAQQYYIRGLFETEGCEMDVLSVPKYREYPLSALKHVPFRLSLDENGCPITFIPFLNYIYLSRLSKKHSLKKYLLKQIKDEKYDKNTVFVFYAMHSPRMFAAKIIKKYLPNSTTAIIVPDLPQYTDGQMSTLKKIMKRIDLTMILSYMKYFDKFIFYTRYMPSKIGADENKSIVLEGIAVPSNETDVPEAKLRKKQIVYSGALIKRNNIHNIIDGFIKSKIPYELCFYGTGDEAQLIRNYEKDDCGVKYCGNITPSELRIVLQQASLLLNIRNTDEEYTKYSCPSKLFEYMLSGTPVLSTKLAGIPDEYFNYMYTIDDYSVDGLSKWFSEFANMSEQSRSELGKNARCFIMENKTYQIQARKLYEFIIDN